MTQSNKRPGSIAIYIEPWHFETYEFLKLKENTGIEELRARELFYALWIPDLFMEKVRNNEDWCMFCPNECPGLSDAYGDDFNQLYNEYEASGLYRKKTPARQLMYAIIESQIKTGGPFMLYKDAVNRKNNQAHIGTVRSSNLCTEIVEYTSSKETAVCNLASIGLPSYIHFIDDKPVFDYKLLYEKTKIVTKNLDRVVDLTHYPVEKARYSNLRHRPLGVGVSGLADVFVLMRTPFDSPEAKVINKTIFETIYYAAITASCELAQEYGYYETYQGSEFSKGNFQWNLWENVHGTKIEHSGLWDWELLRERVKLYGVRNSMLTCTMPTASTSQIIGFTEAFEPINSNIYKRQTLSGEFQVVNRYLLQELCDLKLWNESLKQQIIENKGSIQNIPIIPLFIRNLYKTSWEISQKAVIDMAADRGVYIDQSQSMNIFMAEPTYKKLLSMHFYAYDKGLKTGMYYLKMKAATSPIQITTGSGEIQEEEVVMACSMNNRNCESCSA